MALDINFAVMFPNDVEGDGKAEISAFAATLGCKEWVENVGNINLADAVSVVADRYHDLFGIVFSFQPDHAVIMIDGVGGVDQQVDKELL